MPKKPLREAKPSASQRARARKGASGIAAPVLVIINTGSGTVRTLGEAAVKEMLQKELQSIGAKASIRLVDGSGIMPAIMSAVSEKKFKTIIVGGGDGTISSVAGHLVGTGITMGVLPLGTMNLFAKSLGMNPDLPQAVQQLGEARAEEVDVGSVNGRIFLHQVSLGLQPRIVKLREKLGYGSRMTKIMNGFRAFFKVLWRIPKLRLRAKLDGSVMAISAPALIISNNILGQGILPYPDRLDEGILGIYTIKTDSRLSLLKMSGELITGTWRANQNIKVNSARKLVIKRRGWKKLVGRSILASIDGELEYLPFPIRIEIRPKVLKVLRVAAQ